MLFEQVFASRPGIEPEEIVRRGAPLGYGEWLSAQVAAGFDRTTSARFMEAADIARAEAGAGESDAAWMLRRAAAGMGDEMGEALTDALDFSGAKDAGAPHAHALTERDWKASPWYRKEIPYRPDMTPTRARIMAENFDERRRRDRLIAAGSERYDGLGNMALGFGASLLGSLPDPVNFIPFGGGLKAARTAGSLGKAVLAGARAGAVEGAVSTALVDALVLPDLASRGEDVGFADLALDVLAGGVLGSVFGAGGGALARRSAARNAPESAASVMPDPADMLELALEDRGSGLMREHARNMARARVAAGADPDSAAEESHAAAALFDARARRWAVDFHASPEDYYRERLPKYRTATGAEAGSGAALFHGQTVRSAAEKLAEEAEAWAGLVDGLKAKPEKAQRMLSQTPLVFHLLGAKFREVYAAPHVFDGMFPGKAKKGHHAHTNIDASILKQLPSALADPIAVFRSNSVAGRLVFMVDVTDANGANVVLPVHLDAQHDFASIHILTSAYSKEKNGVPNNKWFETQDSISYWEDFSKPKIVWAELARTGNAFALDFDNNMVGNTGYILTVPNNNQDELLYLLAFLNSRSMLYSLNQITTRFDENGWRWLRQFVEQLRVPPLIDKNKIISIVATITKENKQEVCEILNNVIADIYNFTDEEKAYINQTLSNY